MLEALRFRRICSRRSSTSESASIAFPTRDLCLGDLPGLGVLRPLQRGLGLFELRLGLGELGLEGLLVDDEQELALLDVGALLEVDLLEEPAHPGADRDLLEGPRRPDRLRHDGDGHPAGLDDGHHRGRRRPRRPDLGGAARDRDRRDDRPRRDPPHSPLDRLSHFGTI